MILKYLKAGEWELGDVSSAFIVVQAWFDLTIPDQMYEITNLIQTGGTVGQVMSEGWTTPTLAFGSLLTALAVVYLASYVATSPSKRIRSLEFSRVQSFSAAEISRSSTAGLITRATNDIAQMPMATAMGLQVIIKAPILAGWAIIKISGKSWQWTAATAVAIATMLVVIFVLMYSAVPRFKRL